MAANVLNSKRAVEASVQVIRAFVRMRNMLASNAELARKIDALERKYDGQFKLVLTAIKKLMLPPDKPKGGIEFISKKNRPPSTDHLSRRTAVRGIISLYSSFCILTRSVSLSIPFFTVSS